MKMKSLATLAISGMLACSVVYIAPAMADYTNAANPAMSNNNVPNIHDPNANVGAMNNPNRPNNNDRGQQDTLSYGNNPADQGTPDTATGDDDY